MSDNGETRTVEIGPFPGKLCYATQKAIDVMRVGQPGDTYARSQMENIIERPCDTGSKGYSNVCSAIKHVETNFQVVWRWSKSEQAWVCLDATERVGESRGLLHAARRRAKRSINVAKAVDIKKLDDDGRRDHSINLAVSGMLIGSTSSHFRKKLAEHPRLTEPDTQKLVRLFSPEQG